MTNRVIPIALMKWAKEEWVSTFFEWAGVRAGRIFEVDVNQPISELGSRMLHLAAMTPNRPSTDVTTEVMRFLLAECGADSNVADNYGRTALTFFVTGAGHLWSCDDDYGYSVLSLLFEHGADANVLFTPDFVHIAGCEKWTLAHHLTNDRSRRYWPMPMRMRRLLERHLDWTVPDSAGRPAECSQLQFAI